MSYIQEKQFLMNYGFTDFNGNDWCDAWVDSYNLYSELINKHAGREVQLGSEVDKCLEFHKDQRHKHFMSCLDYFK